MIASQIPADPYLTKMISAAQVKDLFLNGKWRVQLGILRAGLAIDEPFSPRAAKARFHW